MERSVVLASRQDKAGINIITHLREFSQQVEILELDEDIVDAEGVPDALEPRPDLAIFASRHSSESGRPCLTAHFPGNFSVALHGGQVGRVSMAAPHALKTAMSFLREFPPDQGFEVTVEATHHGPLTDVPCFFIEIGSSPAEWGNPVAGKTIAGVIFRLLKSRPATGPVGVGFGGPHYSRGFTDLVTGTEYSISHIVPKHNVPLLDEELLAGLFQRSIPAAGPAILDWKGIRGEDRRNLVRNLERLDIEVLRLRRIIADSRL